MLSKLLTFLCVLHLPSGFPEVPTDSMRILLLWKGCEGLDLRPVSSFPVPLPPPALAPQWPMESWQPHGHTATFPSWPSRRGTGSRRSIAIARRAGEGLPEPPVPQLPCPQFATPSHGRVRGPGLAPPPGHTGLVGPPHHCAVCLSWSPWVTPRPRAQGAGLHAAQQPALSPGLSVLAGHQGPVGAQVGLYGT